MSMIADATKILVVSTGFSIARVPGRLLRILRGAYNPWIDPTRRLPRSGEVVECWFGVELDRHQTASCFPRIDSAAGTPISWYALGPTGESKLDTPLFWRRVHPRRHITSQRQ